MEILVSTHPGISDDCIVSVRCGTTRRQAPLDVARCQALKFPSNLETLNEPLKIDVLKPVASARLVLHAQQDEYLMDFLDQPGSAIGLNVRSTSSQPPERNADVGTAGRSERKQGQSQGPASARDYLELHGVLKYVQSMLTALIQAKPQDPYLFMLQQLTSSKAYARPETDPDTQAAPVVAPEEMEPPKPCVERPVSPQPPPGNPFHLPSSVAGSGHQASAKPMVPDTEPTASTTNASTSLQDAATQTQASQAGGEIAPQEVPAQASAATAQRREEESRVRLQTVLFKASRNGVLEEILQNMFCSPACTCDLSAYCHSGLHGDGLTTTSAPGEMHVPHADGETCRSAMDAGQLRNHVRERLTDAWSTGELEKAVQEALEQSGPRISQATAEQSIQFLQDEIKIMTEESRLLHEQVDRLSSEMQQLLMTNEKLLSQIQSAESADKLSRAP
ncbi:unnamed protein product [Symbiodinium pilosum]|uniref:Uncharacterized protein n=1 Tax=Symbiodinium pilosum TaxID=2952 RepID=A0A812KKM2_SYMPI|nr:unnamed protein product [Symbiodinium pilosum]